MKNNENPIETVSVVGLGYIGLPTAVTLATRGLQVVGVDTRRDIVDRLNDGKAHFSEPDLDMLLDGAVASGRLSATTEPKPADAYIIAVPTPFRADKSPNLSHVEAATRSIAKVMRDGDLVILESTSPVGTTQKVSEWIHDERPDLIPPTASRVGNFHLTYCPERILPGRMVFELVENDRIIGGVHQSCRERATELYSVFVRGELLQCTAPVAEFVKLIENAFRDVNIAFANELSILADDFEVDVWTAIKLANRHPRVNILNPGPGVGGHCIAVDPWFLISANRDKTQLMATARGVNDAKPEAVLAKVKKETARFRAPVVACLGLSYKPDVDDLRESPALSITKSIAGLAVSEVIVVEPNIEALPKDLAGMQNVTFKDLHSALNEADVIVLLVGHREFREVPRDIILGRTIIDTVGLWR